MNGPISQVECSPSSLNGFAAFPLLWGRAGPAVTTTAVSASRILRHRDRLNSDIIVISFTTSSKLNSRTSGCDTKVTLCLIYQIFGTANCGNCATSTLLGSN